MYELDLIFKPIPEPPIGKFRPNTLTGNVRLYLPTGRIQPYIVAGISAGFWDFDAGPNPAISDSSHVGLAGRAGLGLDLYVTRNLALNLEGAGVFTTSNFDFSANAFDISTQLYYFSASAGLMYRF